VAAVEFDDSSFFERDVERAGIRAIQRAGSADCGAAPGLVGGARHARLSHEHYLSVWGPISLKGMSRIAYSVQSL
jgi:hypothetical protein